MYHRWFCGIALILVLLVLLNAASVTFAAEGGPGTNLPDPTSVDSSIIDATQWKTYTDARFDFTIQYSADWVVQPRTDRPDVISEALIFSNGTPNETGTQYHQIVIGQYLYEIEPEAGLTEWTDRYPTQFSADKIKTSAKKNLKVSASDAFYVRGTSPLTEYQYTNIRQGNVVWFVWANFGDSATLQEARIYSHMVTSLKFGGKTPRALREIYGEKFQPGKLPTPVQQEPGAASGSSVSKVHGMALMVFRPLALGTNWWSPVLKLNGSPRSARCDKLVHSLHQGEYDALDIPMTVGSGVYAAAAGTVAISGWDNSGFGFLVKLIRSDNLSSYYAHLSAISGLAYVGAGIVRGAYVGNSGNTGTTTGPHLHFHVQIGQYVDSPSTPVDLTGMVGFAPNGYYPSANLNSNGVVCGTMGR